MHFLKTTGLRMERHVYHFRFFLLGVAVVMVHDIKKAFCKKFLYEPFPVESSLLAVLPDHLNAEIVAGWSPIWHL